jgi:Flp pilus assembly protein TadD
VLAVEDDEHLVGATRERLDAHADDATVLAALDELEVSPDRILVLEPGRGDDDLAPRLADDGVLVRPVADEDGVDLVRTFRTGEHTASVHLGETRVAAQAEGLHEAAPGGLLVGQMLGAEALLRDAWTRDSGGTTADDVREAVAETIGRALAERGLRAEHPVEARTAQGAFHVAYVHQMTGEFQLAIDAYTASADLLETSEAYTFRGWTRSFMDDVAGAIADCKTAIDVDPAFGNPYNDIGAYLLEENRPGEAVEWLEEAADAERYSSRHFPYLNLGRAHLELGTRDRPREALERALELDPGNEAAERLLRRLGDAQS